MGDDRAAAGADGMRQCWSKRWNPRHGLGCGSDRTGDGNRCADCRAGDAFPGPNCCRGAEPNPCAASIPARDAVTNRAAVAGRDVIANHDGIAGRN